MTETLQIRQLQSMEEVRAALYASLAERKELQRQNDETQELLVRVVWQFGETNAELTSTPYKEPQKELRERVDATLLRFPQIPSILVSGKRPKKIIP